MNFFELAKNRYSCRAYKSLNVEKEKLDYILECVRFAPSAVNKQPWLFHIVGNEEEKTATFKMVDTGGFSRNHVWTVYVYTAQARIQVVVAETAPWTQTDVNYEFYNW
jgi:nitroreductase